MFNFHMQNAMIDMAPPQRLQWLRDQISWVIWLKSYAIVKAMVLAISVPPCPLQKAQLFPTSFSCLYVNIYVFCMHFFGIFLYLCMRISGVDENDWTLEPSEQTQGNDLERCAFYV